ncbi:CinA family protein [Erwinia sp. S59]|uniref:CinA family protein n=1 Tax=Erwinia sp. S59 TaxID=2769340 RepID=UPI00190A8C32|nr:CinA family protein [Erwinia sp. S59]MBK0091167.1 CinA family protein [Erwinia sp. S59]
MNDDLIAVATELGHLLIEKKLTITTAESCTSGWVGTALAAVSKSSLFYSSGFITYTNLAKHRVLNVSMATLDRYTAVSEAAVSEMACGAKALSGDTISIATSGYAGPDGGEDGTPPGTVWFAWCLPEGCVHTSRQWFSGESEEVMHKATHYCLTELKRILEG